METARTTPASSVTIPSPKPAVVVLASEDAADPHGSGSAAAACVVFEIIALSPQTIESALASQYQLLRQMFVMPVACALEFRWSTQPGGRVSLYLAARARAESNRAARSEAVAAAQVLQRVAINVRPDWALHAVTTAREARRALHVSKRGTVGELRRGEMFTRAFDAERTVSALAGMDASADGLLIQAMANQPVGTSLSLAVEPIEAWASPQLSLQQILVALERATQSTEQELTLGDSSRMPPQTPLHSLRRAQEVAARRLAGADSLVRIRATLNTSGMPDPLLIGAAVAAFSGGSTPARWVPAVEDEERVVALANLVGVEFRAWGLYGPEREQLGELLYIATLEEAVAWFRPPLAGSASPLAAQLIDPPRRMVPEGVHRDGMLLGVGASAHGSRPVGFSDGDRSHHTYILGKTGSGKSTLMARMALHDIRAGKSVVLIDPHGDLVDFIVARYPADRIDDLVLFDPSDTERPPALNWFDVASEAERDLVIQECIATLYRLYDPQRQGIIGPRFEHWFRNAAIPLMRISRDADDEPVGTFIDVPRMFTDASFRARYLAKCDDPAVQDFFSGEFGQTADFHKSEVLGWVISKWGAFRTNTIMRSVLGQSASSFDVARIMQTGGVLLARLPKGPLGEINMTLLGMVLLTKVWGAATARADTKAESRERVSLYIDELQNFTLANLDTFVAESRKYGLALTLANQHLTQIPERIRDAVFGNVSNIMAFRLSAKDAEIVERELGGGFDARDLTRLEDFRCIARIDVDGLALAPFDVRTAPPEVVPDDAAGGDSLRERSRLLYGRSADEVQDEVAVRMGARSPRRSDETHAEAQPSVASLLAQFDGQD